MKKRDEIAHDLHSDKYRQRVVKDKKKTHKRKRLNKKDIDKLENG